MIAKEDQNGIVVLKWKHVRDVKMLSIKHEPIMVDVSTKYGEEEGGKNEDLNKLGPWLRERGGTLYIKNHSVLAYNKGKARIHLSDQMTYKTALRKDVKQYSKLAIDLILKCGVVNASVIYKEVTNKKIKMKEFQEKIYIVLLGIEKQQNNQDKAPSTS